MQALNLISLLFMVIYNIHQIIYGINQITLGDTNMEILWASLLNQLVGNRAHSSGKGPADLERTKININ